MRDGAMLALTNPGMNAGKRALTWLFLFLITLMFITVHVNSKPGQTQLTYGVWVLMPAVLLGSWQYMDRYSRIFMGLVTTYGLYSLFIYWVHGDFREPFIRSQFIYLISIGVAFTLAAVRPSKKFLLTVLMLAALGSFSVVLQEYFNGGIRGSRAHGIPIVYGNISVLTGSLCLLLMPDRTFGQNWKAAAVIVFGFGVAGSLWSHARGGWGVIILALLALAFIVWKTKAHSVGRKKLILALAGMIVAVAFVLGNVSVVQNRLIQAEQNIAAYISGENSNTSVGLRLEMWRVGGAAITESPITGIGPDQFASVRDEMVDRGEIASPAAKLEHAHNDFIWVTATKGITGILIYAAAFGFLIWRYIRAARNEKTLYIGIAGLLACFAYGVFSISDIFFSVKIGIGYFIILNLLLLRVITVSSESPDSSVTR